MNKLAPAKIVRIIEPDRGTFLNQTRHQLMKVGFRTTGSIAVDQQLRLPYAPLVQRNNQPEMPDVCGLCDCAITDEYVDGVIRGAGWSDICLDCHNRDGIGFGTGRGTHYRKLEDGQLVGIIH